MEHFHGIWLSHDDPDYVFTLEDEASLHEPEQIQAIILDNPRKEIVARLQRIRNDVKPRLKA